MAIFEKTIRNKNFDKLLRKLEQENRNPIEEVVRLLPNG